MDIQELVASVTLEDIRCIERVGTLTLDQKVGFEGWEPGEPTGEIALEVNPITWGDRLEAWFRMRVEHPSPPMR